MNDFDEFSKNEGPIVDVEKNNNTQKGHRRNHRNERKHYATYGQYFEEEYNLFVWIIVILLAIFLPPLGIATIILALIFKINYFEMLLRIIAFCLIAGVVVFGLAFGMCITMLG